MAEHEEKLRGLLKRLFQFEHADLDFGIYRIMNQKRDEINRFIDEKLLTIIDSALLDFSSANKEEAEAELEELKKKVCETIAEDAILPNGDVKKEYKNIKLAKDYLEKKRQLAEVQISEDTKVDIFNHVYQFFSRYYQGGDFVTLRRWSKDSKYAIPYNGEEVVLHWANKDQYYIKTAEYFNNYAFEVQGYRIGFTVVSAETPQNNNEANKRYFVLAGVDESVQFDEESKTLTVFFEYREISSQEESSWGNNQEKINETFENKILELVEVETLKNLLKKREKEVSLLMKHLLSYTKRNTSDYFIHKDLKGFLTRELDFYIKNEILDIDSLHKSVEMKPLLAKIKAFREISKAIIEFLAQIEDFQKALWEKKKFVVKTDYCLTLDKVSEEFYPEILGDQAQIEEWKELYKLEEFEKQTNPIGLSSNGGLVIDVNYLKNHPFLVLDTKFFDQDFKDRLLATFDDLDEEIGGLLVKSENWQALNLLEKRYYKKVKNVYIDPPYNAKSSEILYKNNFKHSSWISLMENRINISLSFLNPEGVFTIAIDENEQERLGLLLEQLFPGYEKTCVAVIHNPGGIQGENFSYTHEYAYFVFPSGGTYIGRVERDEAVKTPLRDWGGDESKREAGRNCFYPIYVKGNEIIGFGEVCANDFHPVSANVENEDGTVSIYPIDGDGVERKWRHARQTIATIMNELKCEEVNGEKVIIRYKSTYRYKTVWTEKKYNSNTYGSKLLNNILGTVAFSFPKSLYNVKECINATTQNNPDALILDYFAGSGTTGHAVMDLNRSKDENRKYILVEMGEYFNRVLKPRILKAITSTDWNNGVPKNMEGISHICKYLSLEQYEDSLNNIEFVLPDGTTQKTLFGLDGYFLRYMLDFESRGSPCRLNVDRLSRPFKYTMRIVENGKIHDDVAVDLVETFNYLLGLHVERIRAFRDKSNDDHCYRVVYGRRDKERVVVVWRNCDGDFDLDKDKAFIEGTVLDNVEFDKLYVNGQCFAKGAESLEDRFKRAMGA